MSNATHQPEAPARSSRTGPAVLLVAFAVTFSLPVRADDVPKPLDAQQAAARIDQFLEDHWSSHGVPPAEPADDVTFLRRVTLDLAGRIPSPSELDKFIADKSADKRQRKIHELLAGPEFPLHFGNVLDQMIQGRFAGHPPFVDYLRRSLRERKSWDALFREIMLGPWESEELAAANRFLDKRAQNLETLTADSARVFFGVDISCAKCHDHPLVEDWKQDHFYGMASFFNRTTGGKGKVSEKNEGDVSFLATGGKEKTARMMFLSGRVIDEPAGDAKLADGKPAPISRREQLVRVALEERVFFSRSIVNRLWQYFLGRGLIDPVDQIHSGNAPAVPDLLDWLAEDFAASGYDLPRLVAAIVSSRAYQLSSRWQQDLPLPNANLFAVARLRPLSPQQLSFSLLLATGNQQLAEPNEIQSRVERYVGVTGIQRIEQYLTIEKQAAPLLAALDTPAAEFQSSAEEALFVSNNAAIQKLLAPTENNLAAQLAAVEDTRKLIETAVRSVLNRPPQTAELDQLAAWFDSQQQERRATCEQLVWALAASAEFRFNH
jgi:hypothetical protein